MNAPAAPVRRVLLVEDDASLAEPLQELLQEGGWQVSYAQNGAEALNLLENGCSPHVILLDLMMPVLDGRQFRAAQINDPRFAAIPVVVISGSIPSGAMLSGQIADWLTKPFEIDHLFATLARITGGTTGPSIAGTKSG